MTYSAPRASWIREVTTVDNFDHALEKETERLRQDVERLRRERSQLLDVKSTDGLSSSEWMMRTARAEAEVARLTRERDEADAAHEDERMRWQDESGLECGGDPGGVTPKALGKYLRSLEARAEAAEADNATLKDELIGALTKMHNALVAFEAPTSQPFDDAVGATLERLRAAERVVVIAREIHGDAQEQFSKSRRPVVLQLGNTLAAYDALKEGA